jgi:hypothetical protein
MYSLGTNDIQAYEYTQHYVILVAMNKDGIRKKTKMTSVTAPRPISRCRSRMGVVAYNRTARRCRHFWRWTITAIHVAIVARQQRRDKGEKILHMIYITRCRHFGFKRYISSWDIDSSRKIRCYDMTIQVAHVQDAEKHEAKEEQIVHEEEV